MSAIYLRPNTGAGDSVALVREINFPAEICYQPYVICRRLGICYRNQALNFQNLQLIALDEMKRNFETTFFIL